jgi:hypothetical protein
MSFTQYIALPVLLIIIWFVHGCLKMFRWNRDRDQEILVVLLIEAATKSNTEPVSIFLTHKNWSPKEARHRLVHATTVIDGIDEPASIRSKATALAKQLAP